MPISYDGKIYEDEYNLEMGRPVEEPKTGESGRPRVYIRPDQEDAPGSSEITPATQVPADENNASAGNVGQTRGIVDKLLGTTGERYQTWPEKMVRGVAQGAISAFTLPGDVLSGKVQPGSPQEIERAAELASLMVYGPAPVASKMAEGTLGSFAGVTSKSIDKNRLAQAQLLDSKGIHPDTIWEKTGFFRGPDDRWRYEILDKDAKLLDRGFKKTVQEDASGELVPFVSVKPMREEFKSVEEALTYDKPFTSLTLSDVIDHPELFKAYPHLKNIEIQPLPKDVAKRGVIGQMGPNTLYLADDLNPEFAKSVILHEIQHSIQSKEGFARGGNSNEFKSSALMEAEKNFEKVKEATEKELIQDTGWSVRDLEDRKRLIRFEKSLPDEYKNSLNLFKQKYPDRYERLKNIVDSEDLLKEQAEIQHTLYKRLMGEVESRNVQARMKYDELMSKQNSPRSTEDTPRFLQVRR